MEPLGHPGLPETLLPLCPDRVGAQVEGYRSTYGFKLNMRRNVLALFLCLASALRLRSWMPLELYQEYALTDSRLIERLLHTTRLTEGGLLTLDSLVRHETLPFDEIYRAGCLRFLNQKRFGELTAATAMRPDLQRVLLSPECLAAATFHCLPEHSLAVPFSLGYMFTELPTAEGRLISIPAKLLVEGLHAAMGCSPIPELLQNTSWLLTTSPSAFFSEPSASHFGSPMAWMAFHFSSFHRDPAKVQPFGVDKRGSWIIKSLIEEKPISSMDLAQASRHDLARWALHISLIFLGFSIDFDTHNGICSAPLQQYIRALGRQITDRLQALPQDCTEALELKIIRRILATGDRTWVNKTRRALGIHSGQPIKLPAFDAAASLVTHDLPQKHQSRWTLDLMGLFDRASAKFWDSSSHANQFLGRFPEATPIEQLYWIKHYISQPKRFAFAELDLAMAIHAHENLQMSVLDHLMASWAALPASHMHGFLVKSIPFPARLKFARQQFLGSVLANRCVHSIRQAWIKESEASLTVRAIIKRYYIKELDYTVANLTRGTLRIHLLKGDGLATFSFMTALAVLHQIPIPVLLDRNQAALLLGYHSRPSPSLRIDWNAFFDIAQPPILEKNWEERLALALEMADKVIPHIFDLSEIHYLLDLSSPA